MSLSFPKESEAAEAEAVRLAKRGSQRCTEGNYEKAINIFKRALELMPSLHLARHDLAMAYVETGDVDNAVNHLIEVLRLNPQDAGSWVVLANLYIRKKHDKETGEKFIRKALEISPANAWALNSLAGIAVERSEFAQAIDLFEKAITANPDFANSYYGLAIAHNKSGHKDEAVAALERLFRDATVQDVRSKPVYDGARQMYQKLQAELVERNESEVFKLVQDYKAEMESFSGYPIRLQAGKLEAKIGANVQMAWKVNRDFHLLKVRDSFPKPLIVHLQSHELTHIKLEAAARKLNQNKFFVTTSASREVALRSLGNDVRRWEKAGLNETQIQQLTQDLINGLCQFLYNCPLDMIIERELFTQFPLMRPAQFVSSSIQAAESLQTNNHEEIRRFTPRKFLNASLALNGAYALFLEDLFHGATQFTAGYRREETFALSQKIWQHWQSRLKHLTPGDEYDLVDEFAELVGVRDWYGWQVDPGHHEITADPLKEGTTNPKLLQSKNPAAVLFFLDAFKQFDAMTPEQVSAIAQEIAVLGRNGLDYASPDEKYQLRSLPDRKFSGLHLMCLMFAGFKRVAPEHDLQMNLEEPFLAALEIDQERRGGEL